MKKIILIGILFFTSPGAMADLLPVQYDDHDCSFDYKPYQEGRNQHIYHYECEDKNKLEKLTRDVVKESIYEKLKNKFLDGFDKLLKLLNINLYFVNIDMDDINININGDERTIDILNKIKKEAETDGQTDLASKIDELLAEKMVWGFRPGQYKLEENILLDAGMQAFYELVDNELLSKADKNIIKIEALGFTDNQAVIKSIPYYNNTNEQGSYIKCKQHNKQEINSFPYQTIYFDSSLAVNKNDRAIKIGDFIDNNCELSFSRGHEAIKKLKNYEPAFQGRQKNIIYSYGGDGIDLSEENVQKQRKVVFRVYQHQ